MMQQDDENLRLECIRLSVGLLSLNAGRPECEEEVTVIAERFYKFIKAGNTE